MYVIIHDNNPLLNQIETDQCEQQTGGDADDDRRHEREALLATSLRTRQP